MGGGQFCLTGKVSSEEELYCSLIEARKTNEDVPKNSAASSNSCLVFSKMNNELSVSDKASYGLCKMPKSEISIFLAIFQFFN